VVKGELNLVIDTHALVWWLTADPRLGRRAKEALLDTANPLLLPTIVLVELRYVGAKWFKQEFLESELDLLQSARDVTLMPLTSSVADLIDTKLNVHDAVIVATALDYSQRSGQMVNLVTKDQAIGSGGLIETIW
jgi:PIN domain nuclease of toxin-antitoxin system